MNAPSPCVVQGLIRSVFLPILLFFISPIHAAKLTGSIFDAESSQPLPARLYLTDSKGKYLHVNTASTKGSAVRYARQRGRHSVEIHTTLSAHPFRVNLKPGRYTLIAERGKEYLPVKTTITIADQPVTITLKLKRFANMVKHHYYSGETHVHRTLAELPNAMLADDLNVALPLTYWVTRSHTPPTSGDKNQPRPTPKLIIVDPTHVIWPVNTEYEIFSVKNKRHTLGAVFILNHKAPFTVGVPPLTPVLKHTRRENAIFDLDKHNWPWSIAIIPLLNVDLFPLTNNHIWRTEFLFRNWYHQYTPPFLKRGKPSHLSESEWIDFGFQTYYTLLNCGFKLRPTAGTASGVHPVPLGFGRVYVHLPKGFSYDAWIKNLNAGRSFVTTGPLMNIRFNNQTPGHQFHAKSGTTIHITGQIASEQPLTHIQIITNAQTLRTIKPVNTRQPSGGYVNTINQKIKIDSSSWIALRCYEWRPNARIRFAHTAPVHVNILGKPLIPTKAQARYLVDRTQDEINRSRSLLTPAAVDELRKSLQIYQTILQRAK